MAGVLLVGAAGCTQDPPACSEGGVVRLLKQLAVGKARREITDDEARKIDWFLDVGAVNDEGRFGARAHCSATVGISDTAMTGLRRGGAASSGSAGQSLEPMRVKYDIILPMDRSVASVIVVESENIPPAQAEYLYTLLESLPSPSND